MLLLPGTQSNRDKDGAQRKETSRFSLIPEAELGLAGGKEEEVGVWKSGGESTWL